MTAIRRLCLAVLWLGLATPVSALPASPSEQAKAFAQCAGGLSAMTNHMASVSPEKAEKLTRMRHVFDLLLEAVLPAAVDYGMPAAQAASWKFDAWARSGAIINDAIYSPDKGRAARAQAVIDAHFQTCEAMVLTTR